MATSKDIASRPSRRPERTPVGVRGRLNVRNTDPEFVYRLVTDRDGRVEQFRDAGYEVCQGGDETIGDSRLTVAAPEGSVKSTHVGGGDKGILMRIRKDWYEEDQAAKQGLVAEKEGSMRKKTDGQYGDVNFAYK